MVAATSPGRIVAGEEALVKERGVEARVPARQLHPLPRITGLSPVTTFASAAHSRLAAFSFSPTDPTDPPTLPPPPSL